jgi:superfamily I DNA/RNA helicase
MTVTQKQIQDVLDSLRSKGVAAWSLRSKLFPDIVIVDPQFGVVCMDVILEGTNEIAEDGSSGFAKKKIVALLQSLGLGAKGIQFKIQFEKIPLIQPANGYKVHLKRRDSVLSHEEQVLALSLAQYFGDRLVVQRITEKAYEPEVADVRRFELDAEQSAIAQIAGPGVTIVTGLPGSGKTLVLAARANFLSALHPNWKINVVCYNNALKPYLQSIVNSSQNVNVETFYEFRSRHVDKFSMKSTSEEIAAKQLNNLLHVSRDYDAILVDEAQDFFRAWIHYLARKVKQDKGGLFLVADQNQSIYREAELDDDYSDLNPSVYFLEKTYRSTKQIIEFTNTLIPECAIPSEDAEIEGPRPRLVWVQGGLRKPDVKRAIALDITKALKNDKNLKLSEIGILCSRRFTMSGSVREISESLTELNDFKPIEWISPLFDTKTYDPGKNTIKMMTIHSSKGLEFKHVFLLGLEELAKEYQSEIAVLGNITEENLEVRLNFVGPTRASQELNVYYSKHNLFLERLLMDKSVYQEVIYPESFEVPEQWQN